MTRAEALEVLHVKESCTPAELRLAYRRAAFNTHPDRGGTDAALARVNAAYALLGGKGSEGFTIDVDAATAPPGGRKRPAGGPPPMPRDKASQAQVLFICRSCATVFVGGGLAVAACTQVLPDKSTCGGSIRRYDTPDPDPESERLRARMRVPGGKSTRYFDR